MKLTDTEYEIYAAIQGLHKKIATEGPLWVALAESLSVELIDIVTERIVNTAHGYEYPAADIEV